MEATLFAIRSAAAGMILLASASLAEAQTLRYSADVGPTRYRRSQTDHVVQTVAGQEQRVDIRSFWRFTAEPRPDPDGLTVRIVHDSLSIVTSAAASPDLSAVTGQELLVRMTERGEMRDVVLPESLPAAAGRLDLRTTYGTFYPVLPAEGVDPGDAWSDTVWTRHQQNGIDLAVTRINRYTTVGREERSGREALRIDLEFALSLEGEGVQQGADVALSGTGSGSGTFWIQPDPGLYLGGREESEVRMTAFVTAQGQSLLIPILQNRIESIELIE